MVDRFSIVSELKQFGEWNLDYAGDVISIENDIYDFDPLDYIKEYNPTTKTFDWSEATKQGIKVYRYLNSSVLCFVSQQYVDEYKADIENGREEARRELASLSTNHPRNNKYLEQYKEYLEQFIQPVDYSKIFQPCN